MTKERAQWVEVYAAQTISGEAHNDATTIGSQKLQTANLRERLIRGCATAAQTAQLDKELMMVSFPTPPSPDEEGQVAEERPPPAPYETDIHMDDVDDVHVIDNSPPTL